MGRSMTFLNCYGDITISWDEKDSVKMESKIQQLLDEGYQFTIIKKRFLLPNKKVPLRKLSELETNSVTANDEVLAKLFGDISGTVMKDNSDSYDVVKGSDDASEIVQGEVVCSKPSTGG